MDSCVTAAIAKEENLHLAFLHVNYGQRTEKRELDSFNRIAKFYNVNNKLVVNISHLSDIGGSCITDQNILVPNANLQNPNIPISYV
ncbi:uncharacterized protein METZ01_LOCUS474007, partial [marine metagenome]